MPSQSEIQALIDQIQTGANYRANQMRPLLTDMLDFSATSSGGTLPVFDGLVANNTTMSGTTLVMEYGVNIVTTSTSTNYACRLPLPTTGKTVVVINRSLMVISLFPSMAGGQINNYAIDAPAIIPPDGKAYDFICIENPLPGAWVWSPPAINQWDSGEITANSTSSTMWFNSNSISTIERSGTGTTGIGAPNARNIIYASNSLGAVFNPTTTWNAITKVKVYTNISSDLSGVNTPNSALFMSIGTNRYLASTLTYVDTQLIQTGSYGEPFNKFLENVIAGTVPPVGVTANIGDAGTLWTEFNFIANGSQGFSHVGNRFISTDGTYDTWVSCLISIGLRTGQIVNDVKFRFFLEYY
jgi:hypothetical protein